MVYNMSSGLKFLGYLFSAYFFQKGLSLSLLELTLLPIFQETLQCSSSTYQRLKTVIFSPFSLKPLVAILSDTYPVCGYQKRFYVAGAAIVGSVATYVLAKILENTTPSTVALLAFGSVFSASVTDILSEGRYSEFIRDDKSNSASKLVVFVWVSIFAARFIAAIVSGPVADNGGSKYLLIASSAMTLQVAVPALIGWLPETKKFGPQSIPPALTYLGIVIVLGTFTVTLASVGGVLWVQLFTNVFVMGCVYAASRALMQNEDALVHHTNMFLFVLAITQIDTSPLDYFYTGDCGGVNLSYTTYITYCGMASSVASAAAALFVQRCISHWSYKTLFVVSIVMKCLGGFVDLAMVCKWVPLSRIRTMFVLGDCLTKPMVQTMSSIPATVLTSKLTTLGSEATAYSLMVGLQNLAALMAISFGHALSSVLNLELSAAECNMENIGTFVTVAQIGIPLIALLFVHLVPEGTMDTALARGR